MKDMVETATGEEFYLSELMDWVSHDVYLTDKHIAICQLFADQKKVEDKFNKAYVNLLHRKSQITRYWCALYYLMKSGEINVVRLSSHLSSEMVEKILGIDLLTNIAIQQFPNNYRSLVPLRYLAEFSVKVVLSFIYRIFRKRELTCKQAIRAWVDVSESMYKDEFQHSNILIYPFALNSKRHFKFIRHCFKNYKNVTLWGVPYPTYKLFDLWLRRQDWDIQLAEVEGTSYIKHGQELAQYNIDKVFTSDEFETAGVLLHQELQCNNIISVNTSHGVGVYCPFIHYDEFRIFNIAQSTYYQKRNVGIQYKLREHKNSIADISYSPERTFEPAIVHIYQYVENFNMAYVEQLQHAILDLSKSIAKQLNLPYMVKGHPNQPDAALQKISRQHDVAVCRRWSEIPYNNPIFVHMYSTAHYDVHTVAPIMAYKGKYSRPEIYWGDELKLISSPEMLKEEITNLLNEEAWQSRIKQQIEHSNHQNELFHEQYEKASP